MSGGGLEHAANIQVLFNLLKFIIFSFEFTNSVKPFKMQVVLLLYIYRKDGKNRGLSVKTLQPEHKCYRIFNNSKASASFLASHFKDQIYKNPKTTVKDMVQQAKEGMRLKVS